MGIETLTAIIVSNLVFGIWEYFLGENKTIDANSTAALDLPLEFGQKPSICIFSDK